MKEIKKFINVKINISKFPVLPREETEFWVEKAIKELKNGQNNLKILDIFSGTGCIGIAVLKNIKRSFVDFIDIDKWAIFQIRVNLKLNKIPKKRYRIYQSNLFEKLKKGKLAPHRNEVSGSGYDFIFANPPYVAKERLNEVQKEVIQFEPKTAWYGGKKGMAYIPKFLKRAKNFLKKSGRIYLEFDPLQKNEIEKILEKENYKFEFLKDQFEKLRYLKIWLKNR